MVFQTRETRTTGRKKLGIQEYLISWRSYTVCLTDLSSLVGLNGMVMLADWVMVTQEDFLSSFRRKLARSTPSKIFLLDWSVEPNRYAKEGQTKMKWINTIEKTLKYYKLMDGITLHRKEWKTSKTFSVDETQYLVEIPKEGRSNVLYVCAHLCKYWTII